jgi:hypothetical protein
VKLHQTEQIKSFNFTREERDQIWAEAKYYWQRGEKLYLEGDLVGEAIVVQKEAMEEDERRGMVEMYLETPLPVNWDNLDLYDRRDFLRGDGDPTIGKATVRRETVSNVEIWCECYCKPLADLKPADSYSIMALMEKVDGWKRTRTRKRLPIYGQQRIYVRDK